MNNIITITPQSNIAKDIEVYYKGVRLRGILRIDLLASCLIEDLVEQIYKER